MNRLQAISKECPGRVEVKTVPAGEEREKGECRYFDECGAPLCPLDESSIKNCVWYRDEEICRKASVLDWIRRQRKIAKLGLTPEDGCFTVEMLNHHCVIGKALKGLTPEQYPRERHVERWIKEHPAIRELTPEERERAAERGRALHEKYAIRS